jgi:hypothetical protein
VGLSEQEGFMSQNKIEQLVSQLKDLDRPVVQEYNDIVRDECVVVKRYPAVTENPEFFRARDEKKKGVKLLRWNSFRR